MPKQFWEYEHACNDCRNHEREIARLEKKIELSARDNWKSLPDEQGWWWHSGAEGASDSAPFVYSVLVSNSSTPPRYFIAYPDSRWCDEVGGLWLQIKTPELPDAIRSGRSEGGQNG